MKLAGNPQIRHIVAAQFGASVFLALILMIFDGVVAWSALAGGLVAASGNFYLASRMFGHYWAQRPESILAGYYRAEIGRFVLSGLLFAAAILTIRPLNIGALMGSYLFIQIAVPFWVLRRKQIAD